MTATSMLLKAFSRRRRLQMKIMNKKDTTITKLPSYCFFVKPMQTIAVYSLSSGNVASNYGVVAPRVAGRFP
jgi:hypothetical protein